MAKRKGFQLLSKKRRQEIASMGNSALRKSGKSNRFSSESSKKALKARKKKAGF